MAIIRYPGSKAKLRRPIHKRFPDQMTLELWSNRMLWEYREPFFGSGEIGLKILRRLSSRCGVWFNDIDPGMAAIWTSVREYPDELIRLIESFKPTVEMFYLFKSEDGRTDLPIAEMAFRKIALHRMSYSGLGYKAGGPIGGKDQENAKYKIDCRWNPSTLKEKIDELSIRLNCFERFRCTQVDFATLIKDAPRDCFIYIDPPYYEKGPELYRYPMDHADHARLADLLRDTQATWVLSYDDHPAIRTLYSWAVIESEDITYTCPISKNGTRPKNHEIIITPPVDFAGH